MIPGKAKRKRPLKLFVMNAKVLKKRKKPPAFSPFTRERAMKLVVILAVLATCGFGSFAVGRHLLYDPKYAVNEITVRGNETLSKEEIIGLSGLRQGENIFRARIYRCRDRLAKLPLIEWVAVSRAMPDTIVVRLVERHPRARLDGRKKLLADYSGVVLPASCCRDPGALPRIVGVETAHLSVGDRCSQPTLIRAMRVLKLCQSSPLSGMVEVDGIVSSGTDDVRLYLRAGGYTRHGCEVFVGGEDLGLRLAKLKDLLESVWKTHRKKIRLVDLTSERVRVGF
jgi:hypothetical protein